MDYSPLGFSVHGILQARILEWVAVSFSRGSFWSRDQTQVSCIRGRCFNLWATSWDIWDLIPQAGIKTGPSALGVQNISPWTTREVLMETFYIMSVQNKILEISPTLPMLFYIKHTPFPPTTIINNMTSNTVDWFCLFWHLQKLFLTVYIFCVWFFHSTYIYEIHLYCLHLL